VALLSRAALLCLGATVLASTCSASSLEVGLVGRAASQVSTTVATTAAGSGGRSFGSDAAPWLAAAAVILAAILSTIATWRSAKAHLAGALANAEAVSRAALQTAEAQVQAALATATAQQEVIRDQLRQQSTGQQLLRLDQLADHRRRRNEETILALQDALAELAIVVAGFARARVVHRALTKRWERPPPDWEERLDRADLQAYKLLQRLPRGSQPDTFEDEVWERVKNAVEGLQQAVVRSRSASEQTENLVNFEAGVVAAQDALGEGLDRLDEELLGSIRRRRTALGGFTLPLH